mgnify:CR=1 FL=1
MPKGIYQMPFPENEPVNSYVKGSPQRESLLEKYNHMYTQDPIHVPLYIGDKEVSTEDKLPMSPPHDHQHILGHFSMGSINMYVLRQLILLYSPLAQFRETLLV